MPRQIMSAQQDSEQQPIAVIGTGCLFPGAAGPEAWWENVREGVDAITEVPKSHWQPADYYDADSSAPDKTYAQRGGFIEPVDFDPLFYGISPNNLQATDSTQLLGLHVTRMALADADYASSQGAGDGRDFDRSRCSVILGVTGTLELVIPLGARLGHPHWRRALASAGVDQATAEQVVQGIADSYVPWQENSFPGLLGNVVAGRIANRFDLRGTNCVVDAACASSLSAVHMAMLELQAGRCDMAISGGMDTFNDIFMYMCFSKTPALSPSGDSRPFSRDGDGTILGEGLGVVVLKRLADAERDGDRIHAVIRGMGTASDGRGEAVYAPRAEGQRQCLQDAYRQAGVTPDSIELLEAHGTGTAVGDAIESEALIATYSGTGASAPWCALGSVKSMIGHTKAAAGAASLIKCVLALRHRVLPPTLKVSEPLAPLQAPDVPFYLNTRKRPWISAPDRPRRAALSAFGFGGSNFHCVLEEAPPSQPEAHREGRQLLFCFSANEPEALPSALAPLDDADWHTLRRLAANSRLAFSATDRCRLAFTLSAETERGALLSEVRECLHGRSLQKPRCWYREQPVEGKLALLFPGQGSQYTGMFRDLACQFPAFADCVGGLSPKLAEIIWPPVQETDQRLRETRYAQPALAAMGIAAYQVLRSFGVRAEAVAGHSFGELPALHVAGCLDAQQCLYLAERRGAIMQQLAKETEGGMIAVFATADEVQSLLDAGQFPLSIVNHNAPKQLVVSGAAEGLQPFLAACGKAGVRALSLPVAGAFHSPQFAGAVPRFAEAMRDVAFATPEIAVYSNTSAARYPEQAIGDVLAQQLASPVRFSEMIETMYADGVRCFVEIGPDQRLCGLLRHILKSRDVQLLALDASRGKRHGVEELTARLAELAVLGYVQNLPAWDASFAEQAEPTPPRMAMPICGANLTPSQSSSGAAPHGGAAGGTSDTAANGTASAGASGAAPEAAPNGGLGRGSGIASSAGGELAHSPPATDEDSAPATNLAIQGVLALQKLQEDTARLHQRYLRLQEQTLRQIDSLLQLPGQPEAVPEGRRVRAEMSGTPPAVVAPATVTPDQQGDPSVSRAPAVVAQATTAREDLSVSRAASPVATGVPARSGVDLGEVLLSVVADKTGYPRETLSLDMSLDTDLGIDSIKRVEILSALVEKLPWIVNVPAEEVSTFKFLKHIVEFIAASAPGHAQAPAFGPVEAVSASPVSESVGAAQTDQELLPLLLSVVADKTGYPRDMIEPGMRLDTELGIDSIKRVEILSAVQERLPELPPIAPDVLARLDTLEAIAGHIGAIGELPCEPAGAVAEVPASVDEAAAPAQPLESSALTGGRMHPAVVRCQWVRALPQKGDWPPSRHIAADAVLRLVGDGDRARGLLSVLGEQFRDVACLTDPPGVESSVDVLILLQDPVLPGDVWLDILQAARVRPGGQLLGVSFLGGDFGLGGLPGEADPEQAALHGLLKTAAREWPGVYCRIVDTEANVSPELLCRALLCEGPMELGLRADGSRHVVHSDSAPEQGLIAPPVQEGDVVVISGGGRGIASAAAWQMARDWRVQLHLLGRSALTAEPDWAHAGEDEAELKRSLVEACPDLSPVAVRTRCQDILAQREVRRGLLSLEQLGVSAHYHSVDVRDREAVKAVLASIQEQHGPVRGLVHAAGVLSDRLIENQTQEQFQSVYQTKVAGLRHLLAALDSKALRFLVLFSSTTARLGRRGQGAYAAANEVLNKMAQQQARQHADCRCLSLNWGPWDGGMVTPALRALFRKEGVGVIDRQAGARCLLSVLCTPKTVAEMVLLAEPPDSPDSPEQKLSPAFARRVSTDTCPVLLDHVLGQHAVLPVALILEWLAHGALHNHPGMQFLGIDDFQLFRGVRLAAGETRQLQVCAGAVANGQRVTVLLRSAGEPCARAEVLLTAEPVLPKNPGLVQPQQGGQDAPYETGQLFHGPALQGLRRLLACDSSGLVAEVAVAPPPKQWLQEPVRSDWLADPLVLDSAFQALILWCHQDDGSLSLPSAIGRYRQCRPFPRQSPVFVVARITGRGPHRLLADVEFLDHEQRLIASMSGYEAVRDASLERAFRDRQLSAAALV